MLAVGEPNEKNSKRKFVSVADAGVIWTDSQFAIEKFVDTADAATLTDPSFIVMFAASVMVTVGAANISGTRIDEKTPALELSDRPPYTRAEAAPNR